MAAYHHEEISHSAVSMHFVTEPYGEGPKFLDYPVVIDKLDTPETLAARVNEHEHVLQPLVTGMVLDGTIRMDGGSCPAALRQVNGVIAPYWYWDRYYYE